MLPSSATAKDVLRAAVISARRQLSPDQRAAARAANARHLLAPSEPPVAARSEQPFPGQPGRAPGLGAAVVICAYLPLVTEPIGLDLLDALVAAGKTVLVPVVTADAPLDWCRHPGPTAPGNFGIPTPTGPLCGPWSVRTADVILVPALSIDRHGNRLGRGGGHYDRTLALLGTDLRSGAPDRTRGQRLIGVLFDGEICDDLPTEPHDCPVTEIVTPGRGIERIGW